jgi:hypothetical protein
MDEPRRDADPLHESVAPAGEPDDGADRVLHLCWPSEFPIALCGAICSQPRPFPAGTLVPGRPCDDCARERDRLPLPTRKNPHA